MPTVSTDYVLTFDTDAEGFAKDGSSVINFAWDGTDGSPSPGSAEFSVNTGTTIDKSESASRSLTWEDMGVPVGQNVTAVQFLGYKYQYDFSATPGGAIERLDFVMRLFAVDAVPVIQVTASTGGARFAAGTQTWTAAGASTIFSLSLITLRDISPSDTLLRWYMFVTFKNLSVLGSIGSFWYDGIGLRIFWEEPDDTIPTPWPLETREGKYHRAAGNDWGLIYHRSLTAVPPFQDYSFPTAGWKFDQAPRMIEDTRGRIILNFERFFTVNTPTGFTATPFSSSRIDLAWTNISTRQTFFRIFRRVAPLLGGFGAYELIDTVDDTTTTYQDLTVVPGTQYQYKLDAIEGPDPDAPEGTSDDADASAETPP